MAKQNKMTKKELVRLIYKNFYNRSIGTIDLCGLDFTPYHCNVNISEMIVERGLSQSYQKAHIILQNYSEASEIWQHNCDAKLLDQRNLNADEIIIDNLDFFDVEEKEDYLILRPKVVKLTKKEIEKKLGYRINIIEEDKQ